MMRGSVRYHVIIRLIKAGIHWSSLIVCECFGGKNWKLSTKPCIPSSSSALKCVRELVVEFSSTVLRRVDVDPSLNLVKPCSATRRMFVTDLITDGFDELATVSLIRSCMLSYLIRKLNDFKPVQKNYYNVRHRNGIRVHEREARE